jgi:hypothetical protein
MCYPSLGSIRVWTQGLTLTLPLESCSQPFFALVYFSEKFYHFYRGQASGCSPPISASWIAEITDTYHIQLVFWDKMLLTFFFNAWAGLEPWFSYFHLPNNWDSRHVPWCLAPLPILCISNFCNVYIGFFSRKYLSTYHRLYILLWTSFISLIPLLNSIAAAVRYEPVHFLNR